MKENEEMIQEHWQVSIRSLKERREERKEERRKKKKISVLT
tara:strand:- start:214 stop:336 length:123 start_codon:yes stop_codon:yes gene_type:complete